MCRLNDILSTKLKCAWHTEQASPAPVSFPTSRLCPPGGAAAASAACRLSQQIACSCFASQCASFMSLLSVHMYSIYPVLNLNRWCNVMFASQKYNLQSAKGSKEKSVCSLICPSVYKPLLKSIHRDTEKLLS